MKPALFAIYPNQHSGILQLLVVVVKNLWRDALQQYRLLLFVVTLLYVIDGRFRSVVEMNLIVCHRISSQFITSTEKTVDMR